jgi:hypothetical protein
MNFPWLHHDLHAIAGSDRLKEVTQRWIILPIE